jgi:hypothetical protein
MSTNLESLALTHLRAAHEPIREFALYDRVVADLGEHIPPETFVETMERLMTEGYVHVSFERDSAQRDPEPFSPRYYRVTD